MNLVRHIAKRYTFKSMHQNNTYRLCVSDMRPLSWKRLQFLLYFTLGLTCLLSMMTSITHSNHMLYIKHIHGVLMDLISISRHIQVHKLYNVTGGSVLNTTTSVSGTVFHTYSGRLGNQLFQYAAITAIARQNNMDSCIRENEHPPLSSFFEGVGAEESCGSIQPLNYRMEKGYATWETFELNQQDIVLDGCFQSYKYIDPEVRTTLKLKPLISNHAKASLQTFSEYVLVGMHIRRYEASHLRIPTEEYFKNAMDYFKARFVNVGFVVVSDDPSWCEQQIFLQKDSIHIVSGNEAIIDMAILIECDHVILSVGTFGFWGAFLGADSKGGVVVYYDSEFVEDSDANIGLVQITDYYPPNWIPLGISNVSTIQSRDMYNELHKTSALVMGDATIVTAYFEFASKHSSEEYSSWMKNMLSLQDPMVIFTSADKEDEIYRMRAHALNRTLVIVMDLHETEVARLYGMKFWMNQRLLDPEQDIHTNPLIYIVWDSKVSFINQVITLNPFRSSYFMWVDIGCMRHDRFNGEWLVTDATPFTGDKVLALDVSSLTRNLILDLFVENDNRFAGSMFGGSIAAMQRFYTEFSKTLDQEIKSSTFVGKDQILLYKTCKREKNLCNMVTPDSWFSADDPWFYLLPFLIKKLWKPQSLWGE
jgi:galactoside 2-L-fucosyltransferase 1/2